PIAEGRPRVGREPALADQELSSQRVIHRHMVRRVIPHDHAGIYIYPWPCWIIYNVLLADLSELCDKATHRTASKVAQRERERLLALVGQFFDADGLSHDI